MSFFPIIQIFVFGYSFSALADNTGISVGILHISYPDYLTIGMIGINGMVISKLVGAIIWNDRRNGMLEQILVMPFTRSQYIISNLFTIIILGLVGAGIIMLIGIVIIYDKVHITTSDVAYILYALVADSIFFGSLVIIGSTKFKHREGFTAFINIVGYAGAFMSTAQFPFVESPQWIQTIFLLNPLTYVVNIMRDSMFSNITLFTNTQVILVGIISVIVVYFAALTLTRAKL